METRTNYRMRWDLVVLFVSTRPLPPSSDPLLLHPVPSKNLHVRLHYAQILPNLIAPIVISLSLNIPIFVIVEAGLSYLGLGLSEIPSLGKMIANATDYYADYPLYLWVPVGTIALLSLTLNLLGDSIRDAFDPKTRR